jgi:hypothetical protein
MSPSLFCPRSRIPITLWRCRALQSRLDRSMMRRLTKHTITNSAHPRLRLVYQAKRICDCDKQAPAAIIPPSPPLGSLSGSPQVERCQDTPSNPGTSRDRHWARTPDVLVRVPAMLVASCKQLRHKGSAFLCQSHEACKLLTRSSRCRTGNAVLRAVFCACLFGSSALAFLFLIARRASEERPSRPVWSDQSRPCCEHRHFCALPCSASRSSLLAAPAPGARPSSLTAGKHESDMCRLDHGRKLPPSRSHHERGIPLLLSLPLASLLGSENG